jgi:hypothetical protein
LVSSCGTLGWYVAPQTFFPEINFLLFKPNIPPVLPFAPQRADHDMSQSALFQMNIVLDEFSSKRRLKLERYRLDSFSPRHNFPHPTPPPPSPLLLQYLRELQRQLADFEYHEGRSRSHIMMRMSMSVMMIRLFMSVMMIRLFMSVMMM